MNTRRILICLFLSCFLLVHGRGTSFAVGGALPPEKVAVTDGHVVHNVGQIGQHVTNWGLIGSAPSTGLPYSESPSAMWPMLSGNEYLWGAGLWVGGRVLGENLVSTGSYSTEFRPTEALADTIHATAHGALGGNRFPWPDADDDGDGLEDEEILNGLDDDGDGLIDEDFAAIGDQHFTGTYGDFDPAIQQAHPPHNPLQVNIIQQSIQWSSPLGENFIGYDFTITNVGDVAIEDVYLGMFSDFDIGPRGEPFIAGDDFAGFVSTTATASNGTVVPVQIAYMYDGYDGAGAWRVDGYAGWVLCGHTTDANAVVAPSEVGVTSFQVISGQESFENGGDATNDSERYELLSQGTWDADVLPNDQSDYRVLSSSGPFAVLAPGQSITYQVALVLGAGLDEMIANAAEAVATYRGKSYDRDGEAGNGEEFTVHWLLNENIPVSAGFGWIMAEVMGEGVEVQIETNLDAQSGLVVVRRGADGASTVTERRWAFDELAAVGSSGGHHFYRLLDTDQTGWPRRYDLILESAGGSVALNQVRLDIPLQTAIGLHTSPNPFNPRATIQYNLPRADHMQLKVFDLRGRLVRTLVDEFRPAGASSVIWSGDDDSGQAMASGVYQLRLSLGGQLQEERVTLVR